MRRCPAHSRRLLYARRRTAPCAALAHARRSAVRGGVDGGRQRCRAACVGARAEWALVLQPCCGARGGCCTRGGPASCCTAEGSSVSSGEPPGGAMPRGRRRVPGAEEPDPSRHRQAGAHLRGRPTRGLCRERAGHVVVVGGVCLAVRIYGCRIQLL